MRSAWEPQDEATLRRFLTSTRERVDAIAARFGISERTLRRYARRHGLGLKPHCMVEARARETSDNHRVRPCPCGRATIHAVGATMCIFCLAEIDPRIGR